ncbi:MAG TPA: hypothetical protein VKU00_08265, partial [Chthonomonadaceae bacterium]|nr:hypothetical protein [Chthonomonadaceae bacterium]
MSDLPPYQQAMALVAAARVHYERGALLDALAPLRQAVLLFASEAPSAPDQLLARADACHFYGDCLTEIEEHAEAANVYQEAADLYAQLHHPEGEALAQ